MKKKIISLLTSAIMIIAMMASAVSMAAPGDNAEAGTVPQETKEVTLHKLLLTAEELKTWDENGPKGYDGTQNLDAMKTLTGKALNEIKGVYFA